MKKINEEEWVPPEKRPPSREVLEKREGAKEVITIKQIFLRARNHFARQTTIGKDVIGEEYHDVVKRYKVPKEYFTNTDYFRKNERADYTSANSELMQFTGLLLKKLRSEQIPMYVHTCYRSPQLQRHLQNKGLSSLKSGAHQRGCAVDIVHCHHHWDMKEEAWKYVGLVGQEIIRVNKLNIQWGGDWNQNGIPVTEDPEERFWDPAHWQVANWREYDEIKVPVGVSMTPTQILNKYGKG